MWPILRTVPLAGRRNAMAKLHLKLVAPSKTTSNFTTATLHVRRVKQGTPATHPILGDKLRALRRLQREQEPKSAFVFTRPNVARPSARRALLALWSAILPRYPSPRPK